MKQIIQDMNSGQTILEEIPAPLVRYGHVLIKTTRSLVSVGTERMLVDFAKASLVEKARQQPDRVKEVLRKVKTDGLVRTAQAVLNKLDTPLPLGYCNVGRVIEVGGGVSEFHIGDRVVSNGAHAEIVCVPRNLVSKIPDNVSDDEASFAVIGSVALQGVRLIKPEFGETVVVIGLGLVGLLACQILRASGCRVIGIDVVQARAEMARTWGVTTLDTLSGQELSKAVIGATSGVGADAVLITASTKSNDVIRQSAEMSRKRGRIVLVGVVGLELERSEFYKKELTFQVSCSYGPGRYDPTYEQKGQDYPLPFVRWTENRNFGAILEAISKAALDVKPMISERIPLEGYKQVYENLDRPGIIGSILCFSENVEVTRTIGMGTPSSAGGSATWVVGAGNFTRMTLLPILKKLKVLPRGIASLDGLSSSALARKYGIGSSSTDYEQILKDESVGNLIITTRHATHAKMVVQGLKAGKNVFVEKPLCIHEEELEEIIAAYKESGRPLNVGYNRRFSPFAQRAKDLLRSANAINVIATINAGEVPRESWLHDPETGGGRIIGEACHFVDLITYLSGSLVTEVYMSANGTNPKETTDEAVLVLKYENGSQGVINYFANGHKSYPKERIEVYSNSRTLVIDDWHRMTGFGFRGFGKLSARSDKGHFSQFKALTDRSIDGQLIPFAELVNTSRAIFACLSSLRSGTKVQVGIAL